MDYTGQTVTKTVKISSRGSQRTVTYTYTLEGEPNAAGMVRAWDNTTPSDHPDFLGRGHWVRESEIAVNFDGSHTEYIKWLKENR